jgi:TolB-like protein/tetratricopeptide (TPR) repeat protein
LSVVADGERFKLDEYYQQAGSAERIRIELPKGGYSPRFTAIRMPEEPPGSASRSPQAAQRPMTWAVAATLALAAAAALFYLRGGPEHAAQVSIAVLPFSDLSPDHSHGLIAQAMMDEIKTSLAKTPGLRVIAGVPVGAAAGKVEIPALARRLRVTDFLEGDVRPLTGGGLRVETRRFRPDGAYIWSKTFDTDANGSGAGGGIERDVSSGIAMALGISGRPPSPARVGRESPEARGLYLEARYLIEQPGERPAVFPRQAAVAESDRNRPELCQRIRQPGGFLCLVDCKSHHRAGAAPGQAMADARKAIALDPNLAEAHAALRLLDFCAWQFGPAEREYAAALRINPNLATAYNRVAPAEFAQADFRSAERDLLRAQDLDPLNLGRSATLVELYFYWKRYDDAARLARQMLATDPKFTYARLLLTKIAWARNQRDEAVREARAIGGDESFVIGILRENGWRERLARLDRSASAIALGYAVGGDRDDCFRYLDRALASRDPDLIALRWDPLYKDLRSDPRYEERIDRLRTMGLPTPAGPQTLAAALLSHK